MTFITERNGLESSNDEFSVLLIYGFIRLWFVVSDVNDVSHHRHVSFFLLLLSMTFELGRVEILRISAVAPQSRVPDVGSIHNRSAISESLL